MSGSTTKIAPSEIHLSFDTEIQFLITIGAICRLSLTALIIELAQCRLVMEDLQGLRGLHFILRRTHLEHHRQPPEPLYLLAELFSNITVQVLGGDA